jgi:hypothetical protein
MFLDWYFLGKEQELKDTYSLEIGKGGQLWKVKILESMQLNHGWFKVFKAHTGKSQKDFVLDNEFAIEMVSFSPSYVIFFSSLSSWIT